MRELRATHRLVTVVIVPVTLFLAVTGTMIQLIDLRSIFTHAAATDPNVMAMRESFDGPPNFQVIGVNDYTAPALPEGADLQGMLSRLMESARLTVGDIPLRYVELRMAGGKPAGVVESGGRLIVFDAVTGEIVRSGSSWRTDTGSPKSERNTIKSLHRMTVFGRYALFINVIVGLGLVVMIITGLMIYFKMLSGRSRSGRANPFWSGGGRWRTWHRRISVVAAIFLTVVALSGLWLAVESLSFGFYMAKRVPGQRLPAALQRGVRPDPMSAEAQPGRLASMKHDIGLTDDEMSKVKAITDESVKKMGALRRAGGDPQEMRPKIMALHQNEATQIMAILSGEQRPKFQAWRDAQLLANGPAERPGGGPDDASSPLKDAELPGMLQVTLNAAQSKAPNTPVKVIRLRYFGGMPQGVIVTGGDTTRQIVFNAKTGRAVSETEPGYPPTGFPFGWQAHETAKHVHRGDIIGLPGRFMDLLAGLSLLYLSTSGIVIYLDLWRRRKKVGKSRFIWA